MKSHKLNQILKLTRELAESNDEIFALGLCGSWARGTVKHDSDIDLIFITSDKERYRTANWLEQVGFNRIDESLDSYIDENYGGVWSRHVFLKSKIEVEFGFANLSWVDTNPIEEGTNRVVSDGFKIIYDPKKLLEELVNRVQGKGR